jgi:hypothetical protein
LVLALGAAIVAGDIVVYAGDRLRQFQDILEELCDLFLGRSVFELQQDNVFYLRHGLTVVFFPRRSSLNFQIFSLRAQICFWQGRGGIRCAGRGVPAGVGKNCRFRPPSSPTICGKTFIMADLVRFGAIWCEGAGLVAESGTAVPHSKTHRAQCVPPKFRQVVERGAPRPLSTRIPHQS